ncbi:MAG: hypothetical protein HZC55_21390 [Verrucomicrobia bacterium]|nr:hypothetical protein [Verrucomicrobiota bacterium]
MIPPTDSESSAPDLLRPPDPATSRRLFQLGCLGLGLALVALVHQSPIQDPILLTLGSAVLLLGAVPALNWARRGDAHFPVFEVFMLAGIPFYGISLLAGHPEVLTFSEGATLQAAAAILIYQACAIGAFFWTNGQPVRSALWSGTLLPSSALRYAQTGLWLNTGYLYVNGFTDWIPGELRIVTRAVFFGIGTVALFIEMRRWGDRRLALEEKAVITLNLVAQIILLIRELYLIAGISLALLALLAYVSSSRKIPLAVMVVVLPILAVLHNGKSSMRYEYWEQRAPLPNVTELPGFFEKWIHYGLSQREHGDEPSSSTLAGRLFERASLFQMLCLVAERTPDFQPYLAGESYLQIPAQLIPSFLWPGKPSSLLSNVMLAIHYRLVPEDNPTSVSIAFGMVAEAYANFGFAGCAGLGLLLGYLYKRVTTAATGSAQFSALGLLTILLAAWSFQAEQIFATWFVSLIQAAGVVIGVPMGLRLVFRTE